MMNQDALISIIVPVYHVERFLPRCIDSILAQTYQNIELILVDDGSADACPQICDSYAKKDSRVRVIHKQNGGVSSARNAGLDAVKGEYIGFVDGDDFIAPQMYEVLMRAIRRSGSDLAICNFCFVDENGEKTGQKIWYPLKNEIVIPEQIQNGWGMYYNRTALIVVTNKLYCASVFRDLRYPEGMLSEDTYIEPHIYHGHKMACVANPMYYYTQREGSAVGTASEKITKDTIKANYAVIKFYKDHHYAQWMVASRIEALLWALGTYANCCPDSRTEEGENYYRKELAKFRRMLRACKRRGIPANSQMKLLLEAASPKYAYKLAGVLGRTRKYKYQGDVHAS